MVAEISLTDSCCCPAVLLYCEQVVADIQQAWPGLAIEGGGAVELSVPISLHDSSPLVESAQSCFDCMKWGGR